VFGFGTATVNDKLQLCEAEFFYNAKEFISVLRGETKAADACQTWKNGCPHLASSSPCPHLASLGSPSGEKE
jgi:hypothetical protein